MIPFDGHAAAGSISPVYMIFSIKLASWYSEDIFLLNFSHHYLEAQIRPFTFILRVIRAIIQFRMFSMHKLAKRFRI